MSAQAQEPPTGPANAEACRACHGSAGISLNPTIPNLAGQKPAYLEAQLKAFRGKDRKNDFMSVIAAQLNDTDIHDLAAYWSEMSAEPSPEVWSCCRQQRHPFPHAISSGLPGGLHGVPNRNRGRHHDQTLRQTLWR
jgi:cytochrome c553